MPKALKPLEKIFRWLLGKFGIRLKLSMEMHLQKIEAVFNRTVTIDSMDALAQAIRIKPRASADLLKAAIVLDSSVFLKLCTYAGSADVVDYLDSRHPAPVLLSSQTIQEFWNNQLSAVTTLSASLEKKYNDFKVEATKIDPSFGRHAEIIEEQLKLFKDEHAYVFDEARFRQVASVFEVLKRKARLTFVPRNRFDAICLHRKKTKTPPGFKDEGDGDFYIWVEMLLGLSLALDEGLSFDHVVLVTNDVKIDWSRGGTVHPVLAAEVKALIGKPIEAWTLEELAAKVKALPAAQQAAAPVAV